MQTQKNNDNQNTNPKNTIYYEDFRLVVHNKIHFKWLYNDNRRYLYCPKEVLISLLTIAYMVKCSF